MTVNEQLSKQMLKFIGGISKESIVDIEGIVRKTDQPILSCSQQDAEIHIEKVCMLFKGNLIWILMGKYQIFYF